MKWALELGDATELPNDILKAAEHTLVTPAPLDGDFWLLHVDGASNYKGSRADVVLVTQTVQCSSMRSL
ncbi:hypothetical protein FF1_002357 [Malus domestica]